MELRIGLAAGVMIELCHQQSGGRLTGPTALATARPGGGALEMRAGDEDCGPVRLLDGMTITFVGQRPQHRNGFRRAEGHVPAG